MSTNGRRAAIRRNRSAAASNVRNRAVSSSESVGAGAARTRVASSGHIAHKLAATPRDVLGQDVERCVLDAGGSTRDERLERYPGLVATAVDNGGRRPTPRACANARQQRRLPDAGFAAEHHAAQSRAGTSASSEASTSISLGAARRTAPRCTNALGNGMSIASNGARASRLGLDAVPAGRDPPLGANDLRRRFGPSSSIRRERYS